MVKWPLCGPKLSLCCSIISIWGIIQFMIMGILFYTQAAPLIESFEMEHEYIDKEKFAENLRNGYAQRAYNCWIAAFLYVGVLVLAGSQFMSNQKQMSGLNNRPSTTAPFTGISTEENGFDQQFGRQFNGE